MYIVVSCPERGSLKPDGSGPYEQEVMTKLMELQGLGRIKIAFDRAGTSNASAEDNQAFQGANALKAIGNDMWKKMVKDTKWFQTYCGGVKKFLSALAQEHSGGMLVVICIHVSSTRQIQMLQTTHV